MLYEPPFAVTAPGLRCTQSGGSRPARFKPGLLTIAIATAFAGVPLAAQTNPTGGVAVHGQASFNTPAPNQLVVTTQNGAGTGHSAINWQSFSIAVGSSTRFVQPSATSLSINRVVTNTPSAIFGNLSSNGRLVLVNQSGITVGAGAVVDSAGFTASALRMTDADALAGRLRFGISDLSSAMGGAAGLTVAGMVTARDGDIVLIAPQIEVGNSALLRAPNGSTILAAGQQVEITGRGLEGIRMLVQARENQALNLGRLEGSAVGVFAGTLRHSGEIQATTATLEGGRVVLKAAAALDVDGAVRALASNGTGGQIHATGDTVALNANTVLDASGSRGGGEVQVGGGWQGHDSRVGNARQTVVAEGAQIKADATSSGDGGTVVVWADGSTRFGGSVSARGGIDAGNGGRAEVSGKKVLDFQGQVDLRAPQGRTGALLLDPLSITIGAVANVDGTPGNDVSADIGAGDFGSTNSLITAAQVSTLLNSADLTLAASGNINVSNAIVKTSGAAQTLTLDAGGAINVNAAISGSAGSPLGVLLTSQAAMNITAPITTFGGSVVLSAGFGSTGAISLGNNINTGTGNVTASAQGGIIQSGGAITANTLDASGSLGSLTLNGANNVSAARLSGVGNISFNNAAASFLLSGSGSSDLTVTGTGIVTVDQTLNFANNISIAADGGINLAADLTSFNLTLTTANSLIDQTAGRISSVITTANAGSGDIALARPTNDFQSTISLTGGHITVVDTGDLAVTLLSNGANKNVYIETGGDLFLPGGTISTGTAQLSLISGGTLFNSANLIGGDVILEGTNGIDISYNVTATGFLQLNAPAGPGLVQSSGSIAANGATTVVAPAGFNLNLSQPGNNFGSIGATGSGNVNLGNVTIVDQNAIILGAIKANNLNISAAGNVTQNAPVIVSGTTTIDAGFGFGNVTLATPGNNLNNLNVIGNALDIREGAGSALTVLSLASGLNQPVRLEAGHNLTLPFSSIDTGTANMTLVSGNLLTVQGDLLGANISLNAVNGIDIFAAISAGNTLTATSTGLTSRMDVNNFVNSVGLMTLTLGGELVVRGDSDQGASLVASGAQTITAQHLEVRAADGRTVVIQSNGGAQSITTTGNNGAGEAILVHATGSGGAIAKINSTGTSQTLTIDDAAFMRVIGDTGDAVISSSGSQTIRMRGGLSQNTIQVGSATANGQSAIIGANQIIKAGEPGQMGNIRVLGGVTDGLGAAILNVSGTQTIETAGMITIQGGAAGGTAATAVACVNAGACALIDNGGSGLQSISADGASILGGTSGGYNLAGIRATTGSQTLTVGNGGLTLMGGGGTLTGNSANIEHNGGAGTSQSITVNGIGFISATAGSSALTGVGDGNGSHVSIRSDSGDSQTILFTGAGAGRAIDLTGGTVGSDAYAEIYAGSGTQSITGAGLITMTGGASGGGATDTFGDSHGNLAVIIADANNQTIVANGLVLQGGLAGMNNLAALFAAGDQQITVDSGGLQLTGRGGAAASLKNAAIVWKGVDNPGTSQTITVGGGGVISLQGGSSSLGNVGIDANFENISNGAFAAIRSEGAAQLIEFTAPGGSIQMTGGTVGSDNHAMIIAQTGSQTIRGTTDANAPALVLTGGASGGIGGATNEGNRALIYSRIGNQSITATSIGLSGGASGSGNLAQLRQGDTATGLASTQTVRLVGGGDIDMVAGNGTENMSRIRAFGATQTIDFVSGGTLNLTGGSGGFDSFAQILAVNGNQFVIGVDAITLLGGSAGTNSKALITASLGNQSVSTGAGGLTMTGGSGAAGELANFAAIFQAGTTGKSQTITVGGGGDITLQGGSSAGISVGVDNGALAYISNLGDSQLIEFRGAGSIISLTGGTVGSNNDARILAANGNQTIRGTSAANAPAIVLLGGSSGGAVGEGNRAQITANSAAQAITARGIQVQGGAGGTENFARIRQGDTTTGLASAQAITVTGGGAVTLQGGTGTTNLADIRAYGPTQTVDFSASGTLDITGGTGASLNFARIEAVNGNQSITGSPTITITGGAGGGAVSSASTGGNFAQIRSRPGTQLVTATSLTIKGGAGGIENDAGIRADGDQTISLQTAGSNAIVIGVAGSANISYITGPNQVVTAGTGAQSGSITIHGGTGTGKNAGIFANPITPNTGTQTIATTGALILIGGSATGTASTCDPAAGGGSCADINNDGAGLQRITANAIHVQGGDGGLGSGAGIFGQGGNMELNVGAGGLTLLAGNAGSSNFAAIGGSNASGSTMTINVNGNTVLDARNGTDGSGALIGLGGSAAGGSITIDFNGTGDLSIFGSNVSPTLAGAGIGTGSSRTGATANITVDAANITLNAGSQSRAQIGHKAGNGGLGNIALNATGSIALNASGAVEASVRTGNTVTLVAGGAITQNASATDLPVIDANLLTATANGIILLDSTANLVGSLNATVPGFDGGDIRFTNAPGTLLTLTGVTMAGTGRIARITADDLNITGAVSNIGGPVILRPLDLARNVHIENTPTAGVLSLSPSDLQQVSNASVLEIGRLDGTGNVGIFNDLANSQVNAPTLLLLAGTDFLSTSGASIGSAGTPFNHHLEIRANNNVQLTNGNIFLANNRNLKAYADDDGDALGSINIGAGTQRVGVDTGNTSGLMDLKGAEITIALSGGGSGTVEVMGSGGQTLTATVGDIAVSNDNTVSGGLAVRTDTGPQTIVANGVIAMHAGTGSGASTYVRSGGNQTISATGMTLTAGSSNSGDNNSNWVESFGNQSVTLDSGGLTLTAGGGIGTTNHAAMLNQFGGAGTNQTIAISNGGSIAMTGGASTLINVGGSGNGSRALIESDGDSQTIGLAGGGTINLTGGTNGSRAYAQIVAVNGQQSITGASLITLTGGASGGFDGEGNRARIVAETGMQTVSAGAIVLRGGAAGIENSAEMRGSGDQTVTTNALTLIGGAGGQENFAVVAAPSQTIAVLNDLVLTGGGSAPRLDGTSSSGARIGGLGGGAPSATNLALTVGNNVTLNGGSVAGVALGSSIVGGQVTNISVDAGGSITLNPGSAATADARIGSPATGLGGGSIFLVAGGAITLGGLAPGETAIRTQGDVTLDAATLAIGNLVGGSTIFANALGAVSIFGVGQLSASALSGDAIEVVAGTTFGNSAGASALVTSAPARWLVYSNDPANDTRGGLVYDFKQYDKAFGDATPIPVLGDGFLYTLAPVLTAGLSTSTVSKTYDGTNSATLTGVNYTVAGVLVGDGDVVTLSNPASATYNDRHAGTGKTVTVSGVSLASALDGTAQVFGYSVASATLSGAVGEITPASLSVSTTDVNKTYDSSTAAAGSAVVTSGSLFATDALSGGSFAFLNPNAGTGKTVTVGGVSVNDGNGGANYLVTQVDNTSSSITAANLVLTSADVSRVYDATTGAAGSLIVSSGALFGSDSATGGAFAFLDKNAGAGKTLTVGGATINDGNGGLNYSVGYLDNANSSITRANITAVTGITANDKVYDGTTGATLNTGTAAFTGRLGVDVLSVASGTGVFADKHAGMAKVVTISGLSLGAADAGNYNLLSTVASTNASVAAAPLSVSTSAVNKTFDGTTSAAGSAIVTGGTLFGTDALSGGTFAFLDKNAGVGKTVSVANVGVLDGNGGNNYVITQISNLTSSIGALALSTWTGSADSLWTNPANWVGGVVPDATNVLAVSIPAGAGSVLFDAAAGTTSLQNLSSARPISVTGGNLQVANTLATSNFSQSGGAVTGAGSMAVAGSFSQSGGSVSLGSINITQSGGNLSFASLTAPTIALAAPAGAISQSGPLTSASLTAVSLNGTNLSNAGNQVSTISAVNTGGGGIQFVNAGTLVISTLGATSGNINVVNSGAITSVGPVVAGAGNVAITANSPLTIGAGGVTASGSIVLTAGNILSPGPTDNLTLNGAVSAGNTVSLSAGNSIAQNNSVFGANGVTASANQPFSYGPFAITNNPPIAYLVNGVPVAPPSAALPTDVLPIPPGPAPIVDILQRLISGGTAGLAPPQTNPDGSLKKTDADTLVAEGEVCR